MRCLYFFHNKVATKVSTPCIFQSITALYVFQCLDLATIRSLTRSMVCKRGRGCDTPPFYSGQDLFINNDFCIQLLHEFWILVSDQNSVFPLLKLVSKNRLFFLNELKKEVNVFFTISLVMETYGKRSTYIL